MIETETRIEELTLNITEEIHMRAGRWPAGGVRLGLHACPSQRSSWGAPTRAFGGTL